MPHLRQQSVADHTFRVMVIYAELCERLDVPCTATALLTVLQHDGAESRTGDIPGNFKRRIIEAVNTSPLPNAPDEWASLEREVCPWCKPEAGNRLIKIADLIETYTFIKMWGHGEFASRVADRIGIQLQRESGNDTWGTVDDICKAIITERGRDI